jgi:hypothetical protein
VTPEAKLTIQGTGSTYSTPELSNVPGIYILNTTESTSANTFLSLRTTGPGGGDPILSFDIAGVIGWSMGIDNSDSDKFKIARSWSTLDSETRFSMSLDGTAVFTGNLSAANLSGTNTGNVTIGTANGLSLSSQQLSLGLASGSANGALSSTDWTTFNNKQNALTNPVTGTGTTNYLSKFTGSATIGNSQIFDNGTNVGVGTATNTTALFEIFGSALQNGTNPGLRLSSSNTSQTVLAIVNTSSKGYELSVAGSSDAGFSGSFYIYDITSQITRLVISSAGNVLVGTTTDSGFKIDVNGTARFLTNSNGFVARFTGGATSGVLGGFFANSTAGFASIGVQSNHEFRIFTNDTDRLTINGSTGAATFTSSVTASGVRSINGGVDGTFQDAFIGVYSGNNNEQNAIQTSVSSAASVSGFRFQASNGGGSAGRTTVVDFLRDRAVFNTNVGIGTQTPTQKLHVVGLTGLPNTSGTSQNGTLRLQVAGYGTVLDFGAEGPSTGKQWIQVTNDSNLSLTYPLLLNPNGGNVGIGTTDPVSRLSVSGAATQGQGLLNISNTHAGGSVYYPAAKIRNTRGDHSYGIISEFSIGSTGGDRPSVLFYSDASSSSWNVGQVTAAWGIADSFGIGYRANNSPNTFTGWPTNYFTITPDGNVLIGTTTDNGNKLRVNGVGFFDSGVRTGQPVGTTTNNWLLGRALVSGTSTPDRWIRVQIGSDYYDILAVYMGTV